nr:antitoxin Xre/MbcA/ParS toxin-binding domain-containing protein [Oceanidesulfovibrio indonesiensis]
MLLEDPQLRAELEQRFIDHWSNWLDSPLPALKGISPREAAATSEGREKVQALLDSAASNKGPELELQAKGIELARKELGL